MIKSDTIGLRKLGWYCAYLLIVWGFFRLLFRFPDLVEEVWFKPIIWLLPLSLVWFGDKRKVAFFKGSLPKSLLLGISLGGFYVFTLALTHLSRSAINLAPVVSDRGFWEFAGISLVTAITEELVFAGFIFQKLNQYLKKDGLSILVTLILFDLIHVPISLFVYKYTFLQLVLYLTLVTLVSWGNLYVMNKSKNVLAPILSHWLWGVGAMLLR